MGSKKKSQTTNQKEGTPMNPKAWPDLPQHLLHSIAVQPKLMQNIVSFGCVIKSWRSPSKKCNPHGNPRWPQLIQINGGEGDPRRPHKFGVEFHEAYPFPYWRRKRKEYKHEIYSPGIYFKGNSQGHVVVLTEDMRHCFLWQPEPDEHSLPYLGEWDFPNLDFKLCTVTKSDTHKGYNAMVLTGSSSPALAFSSGVDRKWVLQDVDTKEPYDDKCKKMQLTNCVGFQGKFYGLSLQGSVVVIEEVVSCFAITAVGRNRAVPRKASRQFREYMFESDGEIWLAFLVSRRCIGVVDDVEVYRLDIGRGLMWVEMEEGIGERALFLEDECCMCVSADKVGCMRNSVYFTHSRVHDWWVFDIKTAKISPVQH